jgi:chemotaxis protein MotA
MDFATIFGFVAGLLVIGCTMCMGHGGLSLHNGLLFWDLEAAIIVYGGAVTAMFIAFPKEKIFEFGKISGKAFQEPSANMIQMFHIIVDLSGISRRDGILALEDKIAGVPDAFLRKGLQMLVDGISSEVIKQSMESDITYMEKRHEQGHKMWERLGYFGPALGMVGTLIGLVKMLATLNDPSKIGAGMAVALLTTFYGAMLANFFALPMECKLTQRTGNELLYREMILAGLIAIQSGDSPRVVADKLKIFLKPADRAKVEESEGSDKKAA